MSTVTQGRLKVKSSLNIFGLLYFEMVSNKNCHTIVQIRGSIPDNIGVEAIYQNLEGSVVSVMELTEAGDEISPAIFQGLVMKAEIEHEANGYIACIQGISATCLLDQEVKSRSFQNVDMTYKELVREVLGQTEEAAVIFQMNDRKIEYPIFQYQETDWEFILRLASRLGTSVIPDVVVPKPELYFGLRKGEMLQELTNNPIHIWFDKIYYQFDQRKSTLSKQKFICYEFESYENWKIGSRVRWKGRELAVLSKRCLLSNGLLIFKYCIASEEVFGSPEYGNHKLIGLSLSATVLQVKDELVQVRMDIDGNHRQEVNYWFPWLPVSGNMMYCLPEVGESIMISLDDDEGSGARGVHCVRRNGHGHAEMQDSSKRYFTTASGKRVNLMPDSIGFTDLEQPSPLSVELNDILGVTVRSNKGITIIAKDTIGLKGKCIYFQAPQEISLIRRDQSSPTVINMCNGFDSIGAFGTVKMAGSGESGFPIFGSSESGNYDASGTEEAVIASTPCRGGVSDTERQVLGTMVNIVSAGSSNKD